MTELRVYPGSVRGQCRAPASKSYTHRALIAGFLARRAYRVRNPLHSDDTRRTREGLRRLGVRIRRAGEDWELRPGRSPGSPRTVTIPCGASGTTLRLLAGVAALQRRSVRFTGARELARRPFRPLVESLAAGGVTARLPRGSLGLPTTIRGPLHPATFPVEIGVSSQFLSSLLLVLPTLPEASSIATLGDPVSRPYVDATLEVLRAHRIRVQERSGGFRVPGNQTYIGAGFDVPGDASSAAYLWAAAALTGGRVKVTGIPARWPQADFEILKVLSNAGAQIRRTPTETTLEGPLSHGFDHDFTNAPDLFPLCGAVAARIGGTSRLRGAPHLQFKESDRVEETIRLCHALGARVGRRGDVLEITGGSTAPSAGRLEFHDHRLVMAAAVAALAGPSAVRVQDTDAVRKSYPAFWRDLRKLGADVEVTR